jgi:hypothetical protein
MFQGSAAKLPLSTNHVISARHQKSTVDYWTDKLLPLLTGVEQGA